MSRTHEQKPQTHLCTLPTLLLEGERKRKKEKGNKDAVWKTIYINYGDDKTVTEGNNYELKLNRRSHNATINSGLHSAGDTLPWLGAEEPDWLPTVSQGSEFPAGDPAGVPAQDTNTRGPNMRERSTRDLPHRTSYSGQRKQELQNRGILILSGTSEEKNRRTRKEWRYDPW